MGIICRFCGSHNVKTVGGNNGNPFDRQPEKTVCLDCGRIHTDSVDILEICDELFKDADIEGEAVKKWYIKLVFRGTVNNSAMEYTLELPREDGVYGLSDIDSPLLANLSTLQILGQQIWIDDDMYLVTRSPLQITKPFNEKGSGINRVDITITEERK